MRLAQKSQPLSFAWETTKWGAYVKMKTEVWLGPQDKGGFDSNRTKQSGSFVRIWVTQVLLQDIMHSACVLIYASKKVLYCLIY